MEEFEKAMNVEDLFRELDENKFVDIAKPLGAYRSQLMREGFTRRESMRLVEAYSKFVYDIALETYISEKRHEELGAIEDQFDPVDDSEEYEDD